MRFLEGCHSLGPLHVYSNVLSNQGDSTILHQHPNDHVLVSAHALTVEVQVNGEWVVINADADLEFLNCWLIKAGCAHRITARDGYARFGCLFSHYDANGRFNADPKIWPGTKAFRSDV